MFYGSAACAAPYDNARPSFLIINHSSFTAFSCPAHFPCPSSERALGRNMRQSSLMVAICPPEGFAHKFTELEIDWQAPGRTRTRTNTNPNDTKANAAGRRGVRVRSANGTFEKPGGVGGKCLTKSSELAGVAHSENAHRKAPDLRNTKFHL